METTASKQFQDAIDAEIQIAQELGLQQRSLRQDVVRTYLILTGIAYALVGVLMRGINTPDPDNIRIIMSYLILLVIFALGTNEIVELTFLARNNRRFMIMRDSLRGLRARRASREKEADAAILDTDAAVLDACAGHLLTRVEKWELSWGDSTRAVLIGLVATGSLLISVSLAECWGLFPSLPPYVPLISIAVIALVSQAILARQIFRGGKSWVETVQKAASKVGEEYVAAPEKK